MAAGASGSQSAWLLVEGNINVSLSRSESYLAHCLLLDKLTSALPLRDNRWS